MEIGDRVLWCDVITRMATVDALNGADSNDVRIRPDSGGLVWVDRNRLMPVPEDAPAGFAGMVNISADLVAYELLKERVREFLEALDDKTPNSTGYPYMNDLSQKAWDAVEALRDVFEVEQ